MSLEIINVTEIEKGDLYWKKIELEDKAFICKNYINSNTPKSLKQSYKRMYDYIVELIFQINCRMEALGI